MSLSVTHFLAILAISLQQRKNKKQRHSLFFIFSIKPKVHGLHIYMLHYPLLYSLASCLGKPTCPHFLRVKLTASFAQCDLLVRRVFHMELRMQEWLDISEPAGSACHGLLHVMTTAARDSPSYQWWALLCTCVRLCQAVPPLHLILNLSPAVEEG